MKDLAGVSSYMLKKSNEERGHASRMIAYLADSAARLVRR
jgi:ferritin